MSAFQIEMSNPFPNGFTQPYGGPNQGGHQSPKWYIQFGMDLGAVEGTEVYAAFEGHITRLNPHVPSQDAGGVYGAQLFMRSPNDLMGAFYTHITDVPANLAAGSTIARGDFLGRVLAFAGISPHLHLALVEIIGGQYKGVDLYDWFLRTANTSDLAMVTFFQDPNTPPQADN